MTDSVFTKIIKGEIPCYKIYEDNDTLAFLDIHPVRPGHILVIPKKQIDHLWDLPKQDYDALMATVKLVANQIRTILKPKRVGVQVVGIDVPHAHVHLIPFNTITEFRHIPDMSAEPNHEELSRLAQQLSIKREF
jgi:histidine triad (HIT) family protein